MQAKLVVADLLDAGAFRFGAQRDFGVVDHGHAARFLHEHRERTEHLFDTGAGDRRHARVAERVPGCLRLRVDRVELGADDQARALEQLGSVGLQFAQEHLDLFRRRHAFHRHQIGQDAQHAGTLDVPQKLDAQTATLRRALDEPGDVSDDELGLRIDAHDAEVRLERGERVVGDLRLGCRHRRDERALAGVRVPDQCNVGHQLQLELQPAFRTVLSLFGKLRRATLVGEKSRVAATALATRNRHPPDAVSAQVGEDFTGVHVANDRALGNLHLEVAAAAAVQVFAHARDTVFAPSVRVVTECDERSHVVVGNQPYRAAVAAVAAVRTAVDHRTFAAEAHAASAAVATAHVELRLVDETAHVG